MQTGHSEHIQPERQGSSISLAEKFIGWLNPATLYCLILALFSFFGLLGWSIVLTDTDLWYHLTSGHYILQNHTLPQNSFFSFINPTRTFTDYYWLFQVSVYYIQYIWGYHGLVILRALIYLFAIATLAAIVFEKKNEQDVFFSWPVFLFSFYAALLLSRFLLLRPHCATYLFMLLFLLILERSKRCCWLLPAISLLWVNLHGIAFPIMIVIIASYLLEYVVYGQNPERKKEYPNYFPISLLLCLPVILLTPNTVKLLGVPFVSTARAMEYIVELRPLKITDFTTFNLVVMTPAVNTIFNILILAFLFSALSSITKRKVRISHILMCSAGIALLTKGSRFIYETSILTLPFLISNPPLSAKHLLRVPRSAYVLAASLIMIIPLRFTINALSEKVKYPFSHRGLPNGTANFLKDLPAQGNVLNAPNNGGFLQWKLYPKYKIFADMQVPFLFTDSDIRLAINVFSNKMLLGKTIEQYNPSFILVPRNIKKFPDTISEFEKYKLIFFDDAEVLYVDSSIYPQIAQRYGMEGVDPFELTDTDPDKIVEDPKKKHILEPIIKHMATLLTKDPDSIFTNYLMASLYIKDESYDRAAVFSRSLINNFPELWIGYEMLGDSWKGMGFLDKALYCYKIAIGKTNSDRTKISRKMGLVYLEQQNYSKAYSNLKKGVEVYASEAKPNDLYSLALAAIHTKRTQEASDLLEYAGAKLPPEETELAEKISQAKALISNDNNQ